MAFMNGLLLDLDWTLIDIQGHTDYAAALTDAENLVGEWPDVATPETSWDAPARICMEMLVALSGDPRWEALSKIIEIHELAAVPHSAPMPGLETLIEAVVNRPVAVVTLVGPRATEQALSTHRVPFATIVARRSDLRPKPAPDQLIEACRILEIPPSDVTMIGDSTWDMKAANAAGIGFIGITNHRPSEFGAEVRVVANLFELSRYLVS